MIDPILNKSKVANTTRKKVCFFTATSKSHIKYAIPFFKSLTKFHSPKDIDMILFTDETDKTVLGDLPKGLLIKDLTPYLQDQMFWFRQKPILMENLLNEYELVVGFDTDQLVVGDLNAIIEAEDYDVGVVVNWNRHDEKFYPVVEMMRIGIQPVAYYNCGLVASRSKAFVHTWLVDCFSQEFNFMQYKEQDVLNVLTHFGNWNVRCFDMPNGPDDPVSWYGILGKGEWVRAKMDGDKVMVYKGEGDTPFPPKDVQVRVLHMGGGHGAPKDNWAAICSESLMERINELIK